MSMSDPLNHLGSIWYPEPSNFSYFLNQYHDMDFSATSYSKAALKKLCGLEGKGM